jgi:hypothetical protein
MIIANFLPFQNAMLFLMLLYNNENMCSRNRQVAGVKGEIKDLIDSWLMGERIASRYFATVSKSFPLRKGWISFNLFQEQDRN